jgi:hypothetical protein
MLQWNAVGEPNTFTHRAYWGANSIALGTDGTSTRRNIGALPPTGQWVRLEVPASLVDLENKTIDGMVFRLFGGQAHFDQMAKRPGVPLVDLQGEYFNGTIPGAYSLTAKMDVGVKIWFDDAAPGGSSVATTGGTWSFVNSPPPVPKSGNLELRSPIAAGRHSWAATGATSTFQINVGDILTFYVQLDAANPPTEIMVQYAAVGEVGFNHRAYWGANNIALGTDGTNDRRFVDQLPPTGQWVRLEVPANKIGLEGRTVNGFTFDVFDGRADFDQVGKYPGTLQTVTALITIPALQILGDLVRTVLPSTVFAIQTNYDNSDTPQVTFSVVSGAVTVSQGLFTAPSAPGTSIVRASAPADQSADVTINVPAVISLGGVIQPDITFAAPLENLDFDTNIPGAVWTASAGSINSGSGAWTAPSGVGQLVTVTATNGQYTKTITVLIADKFPYSDFSYVLPVDYQKKILTSEAEDGTRVSRVKSGPLRSYAVTRNNSLISEKETMRLFWDAHHPGVRFIFADDEYGLRFLVNTDSELHWEYTPAGVNVSFRVKETRP